MNRSKHHWDTVYQNHQTEELGWYESKPNIILDFIEQILLPKDARIFIAGAGSTTLIDALEERSYTNITASDIAEQGLKKLRNRLGPRRSKKITWIQDDLLHPIKLININPVDLWIDRAVLHFFTEQRDQEKYLELLDRLVKPDGWVIIAAFSLHGAEKCSGLNVTRYDKDKLIHLLGDNYRLKNTLEFDYVMPSKQIRPYVYTLFQRSLRN